MAPHPHTLKLDKFSDKHFHSQTQQTQVLGLCDASVTASMRWSLNLLKIFKNGFLWTKIKRCSGEEKEIPRVRIGFSQEDPNKVS